MTTLRVRFRRGEACRALSPQEFLAVLQQALERSGVPVVRTGARTPRPRMTPGPALAPGHVSRCEYVDFPLAAPISGWEFSARVAPHLPDEVGILWQRRLQSRSRHLRAAVLGFRYTIRGEFDSGRASAFNDAVRWPLPRVKKGREKIVDLRRSVLRIDVCPACVHLDIVVRPEGTPKPEEVIEAVFGIPREAASALPTERTGVRLAPESSDLAGAIAQETE